MPIKRSLSPEEYIPVLRRRVRRLALIVVALILLLGATVFLLVKERFAQTELPTGQNYSTGEILD